MKQKLTFCAALMALTLVGCTSNEEELYTNVSENQQIEFGTYVGKHTRALGKDAFSTGDQIAIKAVKKIYGVDGTTYDYNFMNDVIVTKGEDGNWTYNGNYSWPNNDNDEIHFWATYPCDITTVFNNNDGSDLTTPTHSLTINDDPSKQVDFMTAYCKGTREDQDLILDGVQDFVNLQFCHILSKVNFFIKVAEDYSTEENGEATVTVTDIALNNVYMTGEFEGANNHYVYVHNAILNKMIHSNSKSVTLFTNGTTSPTTEYTQFGESLLMLPQYLTANAGASKEKATVTIKYSVTKGDITENFEKTYDLGAQSEQWYGNHIYNYYLNIFVSPETAENPINFSVNICGWDENGGSEVSIQYTPEAVDLGLSVKWASMDLGATTENEVGDLYGWGELEPKTTFVEKDYDYYISSKKYTYIGANIENTEFDAVTQVLGNGWRMPTKEEFQELIDNCTFEWYRQSTYGSSHVKLTSAKDGYTDKYIILPFVYRYDADATSSSAMHNYEAFYWTGTLHETADYLANYANIYSNSYQSSQIQKVSTEWRYNGFRIRPVHD